MGKSLKMFTPKELAGMMRMTDSFGSMAYFWVAADISWERILEFEKMCMLSLHKNDNGEPTIRLKAETKQWLFKELLLRAHCEEPKHLIAGKYFTQKEFERLCMTSWDSWYSEECFIPDEYSQERMNELVAANLMEYRKGDNYDAYRLSPSFKEKLEAYLKTAFVPDRVREMM